MCKASIIEVECEDITIRNFRIVQTEGSSAWELCPSSDLEIAVDLFFVRRTDMVEAMAILCKS